MYLLLSFSFSSFSYLFSRSSLLFRFPLLTREIRPLIDFFDICARGKRARSYASASRWQVVLWWLCALLTPWGAPAPLLGVRRRGALQWGVRAVLVGFVVWAQVWLYREQATATTARGQREVQVG